MDADCGFRISFSLHVPGREQALSLHAVNMQSGSGARVIRNYGKRVGIARRVRLHFHLRATRREFVYLKCMHPARETSFRYMHARRWRTWRGTPGISSAAHRTNGPGDFYTRWGRCGRANALVWMLVLFYPQDRLANTNPRYSGTLQGAW